MTKETFQFDADVAQLIQLVTHSIYSNTDIFLRELISNANDACQKARLLSLQDTTYLGDETNLEIKIDVDTEEKTVTITDTGIGMSREEVIEHIGTIAKSGTKAFVENLKKQAAEKKKKEENNESTDLIGQFGIGFYSAFMVAKKVELITKANGHDAVHWSSTGDGNYEITDSDKTTRGTTVILHLSDQDDNEAYADHHRLRWLIKQHSNYVPVPITMKKLENSKPIEERETINEMKSLWTKRKSEIKTSEYEEFYKALTYNQEGPFDTIHIDIEGTINFKALLFIPKSPSMFESMMWGGGDDKEYGPSLYVQNVLIMEKAKELLPVWLRFIQWVVETPDLSLNVSREILQSNTVLAKIQKTLVKEVLKSLTYLAKTEQDGYAWFYDHYARYLKEWVYYDGENKETIASLLRYHSLLENKAVTLDEYMTNQWLEPKKEKEASEDEKKDTDADTPTTETWNIFYLTGKSVVEIEQSPYLEQFKTHKKDVLLMGDPLDEYITQSLTSYKWIDLKNASSPDIHLGDKKDIEKQKKETEKQEKEHKWFLDAIITHIWDTVLEKAEFTQKIGNNLAVLVTPEWQPSPQMERVMKAMGQTVPPVKRIIQINPSHPLVASELNNKEPNTELLQYLYEQAFLIEWGELEDMAGFIKRVNHMISK